MTSSQVARPGRAAARRRVATVAILAMGLATAAFLGPQRLAAEGAEETHFFEVIDVRRVNVEAYVTDRAGKPVTGLTVDDFQVFEDGRAVEITNFFAVEEGAQQLEATAADDARPAVEAAGEIPSLERLPREAALPDDQRLHLVVFIDNTNIRPEHRSHVFGDLRRFLVERLSRQDRVMVVSFDRSLRLRQPFTSDPLLAATALSEVERLTAEGPQIDRERRQALDRLRTARSCFDALDSVRFFAQSRSHETETALRAVSDFVSSLAGLEGRKAILYVSDGLPMVPGEDLYWAVSELFPDCGALLQARTHDMSRRFREVVAQANASRVTFYAVDASGGRPFSRVTAEAGSPMVTSAVDSMRTMNLQRPLQMLAHDSGGLAALNTRNFWGAFERISTDFRNYYSLGYAPAAEWDGRYRRIEVKVSDSSWTVRHRRGYRARTPEARMIDGTMAAVLFDQESNSIEARLEVGRTQRRDDGNFLLPVVVHVPLSRVVLMPRGGTLEGRLDLYFTLVDAQGDRSPVQEVAFPIRVRQEDGDEALALTYAYEGALLVGPGEQRLALGIRDQMGGTVSFLLEHVSVPSS